MGNKSFWRSIKYLLPYKKTIGFTWFLSIVVLIMQSITIWVGADFIHNLLSSSDVKTSNIADIGIITQLMNAMSGYILSSSSQYKTLTNAVIMLFVTGSTICVFRAIKLCLFARVNQKILMEIRCELFKHITKLNLSFTQKYRHGEISSLVTQDVNQLNYLFIDVSDRIFMQPARLIIGIVLMASLSLSLTIWLFACLLPTAIVIHILGKKVQILSKNTMGKVAELQGKLTEYLSTVILSRSLSKEHFEIDRFKDQANNLRKSYEKLMFMDASAPQIIKLLVITAGCVLIYIGGSYVFIDKTLDGNTLIKILLLLPMVAYPLEALAKLYVSIRNSLGSAERVFSLLDDRSYIDDEGDIPPPNKINRSIEFKNVSYFANGVSILNNLNFIVPADSVLSISGASGAGKTSILSLIAKLAVVTDGTINIDGKELHQLSSNEWRKKIGIITQDPILLNTTIRENLLYANPNSLEDDMINVLAQVGLWNETETLSRGLDTQVGNRGGIVSGGERQRLNIARVLLNDPKILLIDEPTANLDYENRVIIKKVIKEIIMNKTAILVTHDDLLNDIADLSITLDNGKIIYE